MRSFSGPVFFFCMWTEYGDLRSKSLYSVQIRENADQKNTYLDTFHAVLTERREGDKHLA